MKKPASAGARRLSGNVDLQADTLGYAARTSAFQASKLSRQFGLSPAVAAATADLAYSVSETWRVTR